MRYSGQRPVTTINVTSNFERAHRALPTKVKIVMARKDRLFRANALDPRLHTHQLKGSLAGFWAYSVNYQYRVLFRFTAPHAALYYDVGTHDIYR